MLKVRLVYGVVILYCQIGIVNDWKGSERKIRILGGERTILSVKKEIDKITQDALREIKAFDADSFKIAGAMIYWAEGAKTQGTSITNSDSKLIEFMVKWFKVVLHIPPTRLTAYLHIHYGDDEKRIKTFWSKTTGIPIENFRKSFIKPRGTGHRTHILPNGIIKIRVNGIGSEDVRYKILAWLEKLYILSR